MAATMVIAVMGYGGEREVVTGGGGDRRWWQPQVVPAGGGSGDGWWGIYNIKEKIKLSPRLRKLTLLTQTLTTLKFSNDGSDITSMTLRWEW